MATLCIYEDQEYRKLLPLVWLRPIFSLRCGATTLLEKVEAAYPKITTDILCRASMVPLVKRLYPARMVGKLSTSPSILFLNARLNMTPELSRHMALSGPDEIFTSDGDIVGARLTGVSLQAIRTAAVAGGFPPLSQLSEKVTRTPVKAALIRYPWDLVAANSAALQDDFRRLASGGPRQLGRVYDGVIQLNPSQIFVAKGAVVKPGVVLDAEEGSIFIDEQAHIMALSYIQGPAYIGKSSVIKVGAKIYGSTSIGDVCKVGGEVEGSIIHSYSNKQHDGFLGHAVIGSWVNLGADTNNSDLKNNYGNVRAYIDGEWTDTGNMFVGLTMGDHSKSGINSMFNTGTVVGVCCNVFGPSFLPKWIPSFSWGGSSGLQEYDPDKAIEVARKVMARRKVALLHEEEELLREVFSQTVLERQRVMHELS